MTEELGAVQDPHARALLELELGALHEHGLGDRPRGAAFYRRALRHAPELLPALFALARIDRDDGAPADGAEIWQALASACRAPADRADALCEAGLLRYDQLGQREQAVELWKQALRADPACATAALLLEQHARGAGDTREAERLAEAHARASGDPGMAAAIWSELASMAERAGQSDLALERLERAQQLGLRGPALCAESERIARKHGRLEQALRALEAAAAERGRAAGEAKGEVEPQQARAGAAARLREAARLCAVRLDRARDALECYDRALAQQMDDPLLLWERMLVHRELGEDAAAQDDARSLLLLGVDGGLAAALRVRLAERQQALQHDEEAIAELRQAIAAEPRSAAAIAAFEDALLRAGRQPELRDHLLARAERSQGQARAERLLQAGRLALLAPAGAGPALELMQRAAAGAPRSSSILRATYAAAVLAGDAGAALSAADALCATQALEPGERAALRFDQYQRLLREQHDPQAAAEALRAALHEPDNAAWAPQCARVQAGAAHDYPTLAAAHRALDAAGGDAAHLCAAARALLRAGEEEAAAETLREALERAPDDAYALALLEECLLSSGGEREAARMLRETARSHRDARQRELALLHAGAAAEAVSDVQGAARSYEEAADHDQTALSPAWALRRLAERSEDPQMLERAQRRLALREARLGTTGPYHLELGELLAARGNTAEAAAALAAVLPHPELGKAAALDLCLLPEPAAGLDLHTRALQRLAEGCAPAVQLALLRDGIAARLLHDPQSAREPLQAALATHPSDPWLSAIALCTGADDERGEGWLRLAREAQSASSAAELTLHAVRVSLLARGGDAVEDGLLRALEAAAQAPDSLAAAVAVDETLGADDDAESRAGALFARLSHAAPEATEALRAARARALLAAGRAREAADEARRSLGLDPDDLGALELLCVAARALGDFETVADCARRLAERAQGSFRALLLEQAASVLERELARPEQAEQSLRAAFDCDPTTELAFARLHDLLLERHDIDGLLGLLQRRVEALQDPGAQLELRYERALLLRAEGRKTEAVEALEQVLAADPGHAGAIGLMVETCTALERWQDAVAALRKLAAADVPDVQKRLARLGAAEFLERRLGDLDGAREELQALRAQGGGDPEVLARLAALCARAGRFREAVEAYQQAAERSSAAEGAELQRRAGDLLRDHLGASNEAAQAYERALAAYPLDAESCARLLELDGSSEAREHVLSRFEQALDAALQREPARADLLRLLRRSAEWRGRRDHELVALSALCALGIADEDERRAFSALSEAARMPRGRPLSEAVLDALAGMAAGAALHRVAQLVSLGLGPPEPGAEAAAIDDSARNESAARRFELGRQVLARRLGVSRLLAFTRAARRDALRAGLALGGLPAGSPEVEALGKQLAKRLPRAQRKELARVRAELTQPQVQLDAYLDLLELALARAGLLLADDLALALAHVGGGGLEIETFAGATRALDLLRFWLSPRLLELRREIGWGP